jgi:hypothetical protein
MCTELFKCGKFTVYVHNKRVEDFVIDLSPRDWEKLDSVLELLALMLLSGAPPVDRIVKISGATHKLYELKVTPPGSKGPQLRVLALVDGRKIILLRGIDKREPRIRSREIRTADKAAGEYLRAKDEPDGKARRRRGDPP